MTEAEWYHSDDAGAMLDFLWQLQGVLPHYTDLRLGGDVKDDDALARPAAVLDRALHRFYLISCRGIWKLLPQEESRRGVEMSELWLSGTITDQELSKYNWHVEGAAFRIDYNAVPEDIERWVAEVRALPEADLQSMLHRSETTDAVEARELLKRAAYFADYAMIYPTLSPKGPPPTSYRRFLAATVLRQYVGYPGRQLGDGPEE